MADEVYQFLDFEEKLPTSLYEFDDPTSPCVFSIHSFSKIIGPGMRLGWIAAYEKLMSRLLDCGPIHSGGGLNPFTAAIFTEMFKSGFVDDQLARLRPHYKEMCDAMCDAIDEYVSSAVGRDEKIHYYRPTGGFFCFITLPPRYDTQKLLHLAQSHGVSYFAGCNSSPDKSLFKSSIRLCYAFLEKDKIVEGVKRLGSAISQFRSEL